MTNEGFNIMPDKTFKIVCANHPEVEAVEKCVDCGKFFCRECIIKIDGRYHCRKCTDLLANLSETIGFEQKYNFRKVRLMLGGCFFLILAGLAMMILFLVIPYIRLRPAMQCNRQMKQVYSALFAYSQDNSGFFPPYDNDLIPIYSPQYSRGIDLLRLLKCPGTANIVDTPAQLKDDSTATIGPGMSYLYKGGLKHSMNEKNMTRLLWDQSPQNHRNEGINVLYTNGSVKFIEKEKN